MRASVSSVYTDFVMWLARDLASLGLSHPVCPLNLSSGWPRDLALLGLSHPMCPLNLSSGRPRDLASLGLSHPLHFEFIFWLAKRPHFAWSQPPHVPIESIFWQAKRPHLATLCAH